MYQSLIPVFNRAGPRACPVEYAVFGQNPGRPRGAAPYDGRAVFLIGQKDTGADKKNQGANGQIAALALKLTI
jgi:hypothetical protein